MKKLIKTVTIILLSFLLIACSGEPQQDQQQEPKQEEVVEEIKEEETEQEEVVEEEIKEEEKEESEEKTPKEEMKYWIVFFNPDGRELQRTAEKYGSTPKYESEEPVYWDADYWYNFVGWTDKDGNDITEFKPITGNKYIYAKYEIGGVIEPEPELPTTVKVTLRLGDEGGAGGSYFVGYTGGTISFNYPIGTEYSINGQTATIGGTDYTVYTPLFFMGWDISPASSISDGKIIGDVTFDTIIMP